MVLHTFWLCNIIDSHKFPYYIYIATFSYQNLVTMDFETVQLHDWLFFFPSSLTIEGPSYSGKSETVVKILENRDKLFSEAPTKVHVFSPTGTFSNKYDVFGDFVTVHSGLPQYSEIIDIVQNDNIDGHRVCLIFDDTSVELFERKSSKDLYGRLMHHENTFIITTMHNHFEKGQSARNCLISSSYSIFTKTLRELAQIKRIGTSLFPGKGTLFSEIYKDAVKTDSADESGVKIKRYPPSLLYSAHPFYTNPRFQLFSNWLDGLNSSTVIAYEI